ncbi:leucyl aminopeptidase family protein [Soonwooa sp.]|uniref:M17 family metallopeptidase n=1 Tax=Soonwooa sp. TaxID=1938592 RepID=UPI00262CCEC2|nr:leucyl aminopeptidase family protein [Soonwooa sp.]
MSKKNTTKQSIHLFTTEDWSTSKVNFPKNIQLFFSAEEKDFFVNTDEDSVQYFIGMGKQMSTASLLKVAKSFSYKYRKSLLPQKLLIENELSNEDLEVFIIGLFQGTYQYPFKNEHPFWNSDFEIETSKQDKKTINAIVKDAKALCIGQFAGMDWLNKPANQKKVDAISSFLKDISKKYKFKYKVYNREESIKKGLGAFVAVNQGSAMDAAFTILEYQSPKKSAPTIGLVGKCVLFDTGGISIKPSTNLHYMKSDMGGASAVIGALIYAAEMQLPINIVAVLPITDNAVSEKAYLPSDVVKAYNGKTIEIIDTDAEGRLTLADGLSYVTKNYKIDHLIDLATLTGSSVRMFGNTCGAYFCNDDKLNQKLLSSSEKSQNKIWNLPLWDIWKSEITSDVADFKNISLKPVGDCIVAAKFLEQFINEHPSWAHLDIAGVAYGNVDYAKDKAATGYGVHLLAQLFKTYN